jgi:hypothetical protein
VFASVTFAGADAIAEDLAGKHIIFQAKTTMIVITGVGNYPLDQDQPLEKIIINVLKDGKIIVIHKAWTCENISSNNLVGEQAFLGRTTSYSYTCMQLGRPDVYHVTSRADWDGKELKLEFKSSGDIGTGGHLDDLDTWEISVNGSSCSGAGSVVSKSAEAESHTDTLQKVIVSCSVSAGFAR